jgi:quercetin dioxygenase-like cupin family protein
MFTKKSAVEYRQSLPGIKIKTTVHGGKTLMTEFFLEKGSILPEHSHVHEQTGYMVSGRLTLIIGGEPHDAEPGDSWCIPENVAHGARVLEDSVAVEVFSPVRQDYLP